MKKYIVAACLFSFLLNCNEEVNISFVQTEIETEKDAKIAIHIPKASGTKSVSETINKTLVNYVANLNVMDTDSIINSSLEEAVEEFNSDYNSFIKNFPDTVRKWEFFVDGEVTYKSPELISIAINSYTDTGGAHGNTIIRFFNFDAQTGRELSKQDLIKDEKTFSKIAERIFEEETAQKNESHQESGNAMQDFFFGEDFQLPETIGFSDEGVLILYNTYEIAAYAQGITEFTITYPETEGTLRYNPIEY